MSANWSIELPVSQWRRFRTKMPFSSWSENFACMNAPNPDRSVQIDGMPITAHSAGV